MCLTASFSTNSSTFSHHFFSFFLFYPPSLSSILRSRESRRKRGCNLSYPSSIFICSFWLVFCLFRFPISPLSSFFFFCSLLLLIIFHPFFLSFRHDEYCKKLSPHFSSFYSLSPLLLSICYIFSFSFYLSCFLLL